MRQSTSGTLPSSRAHPRQDPASPVGCLAGGVTNLSRSGIGLAAAPSEPSSSAAPSAVMGVFAVVAHRVTPTKPRVGQVVAPAQAVARLGPGDIALGRLDVLPSLDGVEPGLWALERLASSGVIVLNGRRTLVAAHDKLATAAALFDARVPHPRTVHVASWLPLPELEPPVVFKPRFGSWGEDVIRCDDEATIEQTLALIRTRRWFEATGGVAQKLVAPRGFDLRLVVARGRVIGAVRRVAAPGEWRTNVPLGARREPVVSPAAACEIGVAAAGAI